MWQVTEFTSVCVWKLLENPSLCGTHPTGREKSWTRPESTQNGRLELHLPLLFAHKVGSSVLSAEEKLLFCSTISHTSHHSFSHCHWKRRPGLVWYHSLRHWWSTCFKRFPHIHHKGGFVLPPHENAHLSSAEVMWWWRHVPAKVRWDPWELWNRIDFPSFVLI